MSCQLNLVRLFFLPFAWQWIEKKPLRSKSYGIRMWCRHTYKGIFSLCVENQWMALIVHFCCWRKLHLWGFSSLSHAAQRVFFRKYFSNLVRIQCSNECQSMCSVHSIEHVSLLPGDCPLSKCGGCSLSCYILMTKVAAPNELITKIGTRLLTWPMLPFMPIWWTEKDTWERQTTVNDICESIDFDIWQGISDAVAQNRELATVCLAKTRAEQKGGGKDGKIKRAVGTNELTLGMHHLKIIYFVRWLTVRNIGALVAKMRFN